MVAVSLHDTLDITPAADGITRLHCDCPGLSTGPDNLVCRAVELVRRHSGHAGGVCLHLRKRIPLAAGLAGGSSDAAATLAGLNRLWQLGWDRDRLATLGAELGSDVPFFFFTPAAWCTGRGEVVEPLTLQRDLDLVVVAPPVGLSTAEVFRGVTVPQQPIDGGPLRRAVAAGIIEEAGRLLHNRLQPAAERLCPLIAGWQARLAGLGPGGQQMSGSGSALFALCRDSAEALRLARALRSVLEDGDWARFFIVRSCS
jgi:4-diphosphocytidyl-2-C-methyl-D-erythritol kinase